MNTGMVSIMRQLWMITLLLPIAVACATSGGLLSIYPGGYDLQAADSLYVTTTIRGQVAITKTTQVFRSMYQKKATVIFGCALHSAAILTDINWQIRGMFGAGPWYTGVMKVTDSLRPNGEQAPLESRKSNMLISFYDTPYMLSIPDTVVRGDRIVIEMTYVEVLPYVAGRLVYKYMPNYSINPATWKQMPIMTINRWDVEIQSSTEIRDLVAQQRSALTIDQKACSVRMQGNRITSADNIFTISYVPEYREGSMNVMSAKPDDEDGYAIMTALPESIDTCSRVIPNRITFVVDRSATMDAGRLRFARLAAESAIRKLASDDVFNIVHYDSVLRTWSSGHLPATPANIDSAIQYVRRLTGYSGNNVMSAMTNALIGHKRDEYVNSVVLLTDGDTPIDHQLLSATNRSSSRVFVLGTGWGLNGYRLQRIVRDHNGAALFILRDTQFDSVASALFDLFRDPIIKNTDIRCAPQAIVSDWYPSSLPDIYQGQQFLMVGRYTTPGNLNVSVNGTNRNGLVSYDYTAGLSDSLEMLDAIKTIWAKYRIDMMLLWMRIEPDGSLRSKEWYEEVVRLGMTYGINTPFTARVAGHVIDQSTSVRSLVSPSKNTMSCSVSPNPLSDNAAIGIQLTDRQYKRVRVDIVDAYGNMVRTLHDQPADAGVLQMQWNGQNQEGLQVASGMYQLHVTCDGVMSATNIVVVR